MFWTLLFVGLVIYGIYSKIKKAFLEVSNLPQSDPASDTAHDAAAETEGGQPYFSYENMDDAPYFSYEAVEDATSANVRTKRMEMQPCRQPVVAETAECEAPAFDLRRAVVYQTILHNPYLPELETR